MCRLKHGVGAQQHHLVPYGPLEFKHGVGAEHHGPHEFQHGVGADQNINVTSRAIMEASVTDVWQAAVDSQSLPRGLFQQQASKRLVRDMLQLKVDDYASFDRKRAKCMHHAAQSTVELKMKLAPRDEYHADMAFLKLFFDEEVDARGAPFNDDDTLAKMRCERVKAVTEFLS